jgi:hypothetical protein
MQLLRRPMARLGLLVVAGCVAVPLMATTPAQAVGPTLSATPNDGLANGDQITVTGSGFTPSESLALLECTAPAPSAADGAADCNESGVVTTAADSSGSLVGVSFTVASGAVGSGGAFCPSKVAGGGCYLVAADLSSLSAVADTTITFAPVMSVTPSTGVKPGQSLTVNGYGFPASQTAFVVECASPPSGSTCDAASFVPMPTDANGSMSGQITAVTGTWGGESCSLGGLCLISATTAPSGGVPDSSASTSFTFAKPVSVSKTRPGIFATGAASHGKVKIAGEIEVKLTGMAGLNVTISERANSSARWRRVRTITSGRNGDFTLGGLTHYEHREQYRLSHARQKVGNTIVESATSSTITVR